LGKARDILQKASVSSKAASEFGVNVAADGRKRSAYDLLAFSDVSFALLSENIDGIDAIEPGLGNCLKAEALYAQYTERQMRDAANLRKDEARSIPADFDYGSLSGLSNELSQKLAAARPETLAQAGRIEGMTPSALTLILAKLRQNELRRA
ncbi:MAG: tRNA uridine-5-carboxymethylaminomethyl(34) synthesis enzyme MnmG, partial [Pseudomonadota bacterium]